MLSLTERIPLSISDREPFWRSYTAENMEFIVMLDERFEPVREGYNPDDKTRVQIYFEYRYESVI